MTTSVSISLSPILQFFNNQGQPNAGGSVLTQVGGVNYATYQDSAGSIPLPNPIPLNNRGEVSNSSGVSSQLFLVNGAAYTFTLFDPMGNQINEATYVVANERATVELEGDLAAPSGSSLVGYLPGGTGAVARTVQSALRDGVSVKDFGAVGDGITDDTAAIMLAYAFSSITGSELVFPAGDYAVTTVNFSGSDVCLRFLGLANIKGIATVATPAVVQLTFRQAVMYNFCVNQNFNTNYTSAVWWHSPDSGNPAQFIKIYGMKIRNATKGIIFGADVGVTAVNSAQSENTVYSYTCRGVQVPLIFNQPNGFLTLVAPILDCNPNEWAGVAGYSETTFQTNAYCFRCPAGQGQLFIIGGEILKTTSTIGYAFTGSNFWISGGTCFECAGVQGYLDGGISIVDTGPGSMTCGGVTNGVFSAFEIDPAAVGRLYLRNYQLYRPAGSSGASSASFIKAASGTPALTVTIRDCILGEWTWNSTVPLVTGVTLAEYDNNQVTVNSAAPLSTEQQGYWVDKTGSRASTTIYKNTGNKRLRITAQLLGVANGTLQGSLQTSPASDLSAAIDIDRIFFTENSASGHQYEAALQAEIPPYAYYRLNLTTGTIYKWAELN